MVVVRAAWWWGVVASDVERGCIPTSGVPRRSGRAPWQGRWGGLWPTARLPPCWLHGLPA